MFDPTQFESEMAALLTDDAPTPSEELAEELAAEELADELADEELSASWNGAVDAPAAELGDGRVDELDGGPEVLEFDGAAMMATPGERAAAFVDDPRDDEHGLEMELRAQLDRRRRSTRGGPGARDPRGGRPARATDRSDGLGRPGDDALLAAIVASDLDRAEAAVDAISPLHLPRLLSRLRVPTPGDALALELTRASSPAFRMQVITLLKRKIAEHQLGARLAVAVAPGNLDVVRASQGAKPQLVATGHDALRWVGRHIGRTKLTVASSYGPVDLTPGTIWDGGKLLVLVDAQTVHYTVGRNLYRWNTSDFIRDEWLGALARAAHNARGMVTLVKVEVEFLTGLLVGPEIVLAVSAARIAWFAHRNYKLLGELWAHADQFTNAWRAFAALCPKTHALVDREVWRAVVRGITGARPDAAEGAFLLGRLIRGGAMLQLFTPATFLKMAVQTTTLVTVIDSLAIISRGLAATARTTATALRTSATLRERLAKAHIRVSDRELGVLVAEMYEVTRSRAAALAAVVARIVVVGAEFAAAAQRVADRWEAMTD